MTQCYDVYSIFWSLIYQLILKSKGFSDSPPATVPLHVLVTSARPDIIIIEDVTITLLELTIPINTKRGLHNAREQKLSTSLFLWISNLEDL